MHEMHLANATETVNLFIQISSNPQLIITHPSFITFFGP